MRPTLNLLSDDLIDRILDEALRVLAETGMEIRGTGDAAPAARSRPADGRRRRARPVPARRSSSAAIADAPKSFTLFDRDGNPHADLGGDRVHFVPGSSGLKCSTIGPARPAWPNSTDFVEYVRLADGLEHIAYLATAFSTNDDIEAQVSDAWRLYMIADQLEEARSCPARSPSTACRGWSR